MKKTNKITVLLMAATLCSCSNDNNDNTLPQPEAAEITLSAGVPTVATRAVIATGSSFKAGIAGWESSTGAADYTAAAEWVTDADIKASTSAQAVTLTESQVYHASSSVLTYMKAWYPNGTLSEGKVDLTANDDYAADGTCDVLLAREICGSKADREGKVLAFEHVTTQLIFNVVEGEGLAAGTTIDKIEILAESIPTGIDLAADELVVEAVDALTVPGITAGAKVIGAAAVVGEPVMIAAPEANTVNLRVTTSTAVFENVVATIDTDTAFQPGKAYTITLTFNQKEIELSATVAEWTQGTGAGIVE